MHNMNVEAVKQTIVAAEQDPAAAGQSVAFDGEWGQQQPRTQIVAIGAAGALGEGDLEKHFGPCLAEGTGDRPPFEVETDAHELEIELKW